MALADVVNGRARVMRRPMSPAVRKASAVGAFVLGGLVLCIIGILLFGGTRFLEPKLRVVVYFQDSVAGLAVGAPVTLRGVQIGTVSRMRVYIKLPELVPVIPVYLDIDPNRVSWQKGSKEATANDLELAIRAGLRAQLETQSLVTGQASVNLDFHPDTPANMVSADSSVPEIPSIPSDFQHIKDQIADLNLKDLTEKARSALVNINAVAADLNGKLGPMVDSIKQTSDTAQLALETVNVAVHQVQGDASRTLNSINDLAVSAQGQVTSSGKNVDETLADVRQVANEANKLLGSLNEVTAAHGQVRSDLASTMRDLANAASSLRGFSHDIESHPSDLLLGHSSK
jgi:paraquat-inducible protein B